MSNGSVNSFALAALSQYSCWRFRSPVMLPVTAGACGHKWVGSWAQQIRLMCPSLVLFGVLPQGSVECPHLDAVPVDQVAAELDVLPPESEGVLVRDIQ